MDVATNVGQEMFEANIFPFPPGHIIHSVLNRSTVNVSYRYLPNMGEIVAKHNSKLVKKSDRTPPKCNCHLLQDGVVYQATVTNAKGIPKNM